MLLCMSATCQTMRILKDSHLRLYRINSIKSRCSSSVISSKSSLDEEWDLAACLPLLHHIPLLNSSAPGTQVWIVGINHRAANSSIRRIRKAMAAVKPHAVCLELDGARSSSVFDMHQAHAHLYSNNSTTNTYINDNDEIDYSSPLHGMEMGEAARLAQSQEYGAAIVKLIDNQEELWYNPMGEYATHIRQRYRLSNQFPPLVGTKVSVVAPTSRAYSRSIFSPTTTATSSSSSSSLLSSHGWFNELCYKAILRYAFRGRDIEQEISDDVCSILDLRRYLAYFSRFRPLAYHYLIELRNAGMVDEIARLARDVFLLRRGLQEKGIITTTTTTSDLQDNLAIHQLLSNTDNKEPLRILAVVGKAHVSGMLELWEQLGIEKQDWTEVGRIRQQQQQFTESDVAELLDRILK